MCGLFTQCNLHKNTKNNQKKEIFMKYDKDKYKKAIQIIKKLKLVKQLDVLENCFDASFNRIKKESELKEKGTNLVKLIQECEILKKIGLKVSKSQYAIITIITAEELKYKLGIVYEAFEDKRQTRFMLYTMDGGVITSE